MYMCIFKQRRKKEKKKKKKEKKKQYEKKSLQQDFTYTSGAFAAKQGCVKCFAFIIFLKVTVFQVSTVSRCTHIKVYVFN